ncbi:MAG: hypothetical protein JWQ91_1327 [Aeromicrobium sp.]|jgi:hypothetical protein|nr:hypothetical protein [Aeromicrobium sp.]
MAERDSVTQVTWAREAWDWGPDIGVQPPAVATVTAQNKGRIMAFILWIIAVAIAIYGILRLVRGDILVGIILLVVAALVGPGGYSIFK